MDIEMLIVLLKLATAMLVLATAIIKLLSAARGSNDRDDKEEGR